MLIKVVFHSWFKSLTERTNEENVDYQKYINNFNTLITKNVFYTILCQILDFIVLYYKQLE